MSSRERKVYLVAAGAVILIGILLVVMRAS